MSKIILLDKSVYNKISAGEVVEKPASVVKELVENSIDAGSSSIQIEICNGGITSISVKDNGCGIEKEDITTAFLPHATSKISNESDLFELQTLGFRGEALASISAVSQTTLITKTKNNDTGYKICVNGGDFEQVTEIASSTGTFIKIENLFYNVPARAKFLRKPKSEESDITNIVQKLMLAHPEIDFKYIVDNKTVYNTSNSVLCDIIYTIYGEEVYDNLIPVDYENNGYSIKGYISKPSISKPNRTYQTLFVNDRYVQNYMINSSVQNVYDNYLMKGKFPFFVLKLYLPQNALDVNVHPNKLEVKFENSNFVYGIFNTAVNRALFDDSKVITEIKSADSSDNISIISDEDNKITNDIIAPNNNKDLFSSITNNQHDTNLNSKNNNGLFIFEDTLLKENKEVIIQQQTIPNNVLEKPAETIQPSNYSKQERMENIVGYSIVGTLFSTYLVLQGEDRVYFIDQHASHERQLYDKLMKEVNDCNVSQQNLLIPYVLNVNNQEYDFVLNNIAILKSFGFDIDEFGQNSFKVSAVPYILNTINLKTFFNSLLADFGKVSKKPIDYIKEYFTQKACKAAVKAGMTLSNEEIDKLVNDFVNNNTPLLCPHGRPVIFSLTKTEFEKMFKRIV